MEFDRAAVIMWMILFAVGACKLIYDLCVAIF